MTPQCTDPLRSHILLTLGIGIVPNSSNFTFLFAVGVGAQVKGK
jgi:hypothetical protein